MTDSAVVANQPQHCSTPAAFEAFLWLVGQWFFNKLKLHLMMPGYVFFQSIWFFWFFYFLVFPASFLENWIKVLLALRQTERWMSAWLHNVESTNARNEQTESCGCTSCWTLDSKRRKWLVSGRTSSCCSSFPQPSCSLWIKSKQNAQHTMSICNLTRLGV